MKLKIIFLIVTLSLMYCYHHFFMIGMIKGVYLNRNFENSIVGADFQDTLILFENKKFESKFWGKGNFELVFSLTGTKINLYSDNSFFTTLYRSWFSKPRIVVVEDLNNYYEKQ